MFCFCESIEEAKIKKHISNVTNMMHMFYGCSSLKKLNLDNFNTKNVTDMVAMFANCSSLKKLDLSNFNTSKVTNMSSMFTGCSSLEELDLSNFNTENVKNMQAMFFGCSKLKLIRGIERFKLNKKTKKSPYIFEECSDELKEEIKKLNKFNIK